MVWVFRNYLELLSHLIQRQIILPDFLDILAEHGRNWCLLELARGFIDAPDPIVLDSVLIGEGSESVVLLVTLLHHVGELLEGVLV